MNQKIARKDLETWADYLLDYSLGGITQDDIVMIKGEHICWPLMSVLQDKIFTAGGIADMNIVAPDNDRGKVWGASITKFGTPEQIWKVPEWHEQRYKNMTKYIEVLGAESPDLFDNLPEETAMAVMRADEPFKNIRLLKPWVLTLYPTEGFANLEGMSLEDYTRVIVNASTVDPRLLEKVEEPIYQLLSKSKVVRIQTEHPKTHGTSVKHSRAQYY
ncbi:MAG: aminopeptidase [Calditrichota bacterium]